MTTRDDGDNASAHDALDDDALCLSDPQMAWVREKQAAYQAELAVTPVSTTDGELAAVVAIVAGLADGNCATKADVKLVQGHAATRAVRLGMKVTIGWGSTNRALPGNLAVDGSRSFAGFAGVQAYLEDACSAACQDPAAAKRVADQIALSPVTALDGYQDKYQIERLPYTAHLVEKCESCNAAGNVRCIQANCNDGKVKCWECNQTGEATCRDCNGTRIQFINNQTQSCRNCQGSGRRGPCQRCNGAGKYNCIMCHGTGEVGCIPCQKTGCFTRIYNSHLTGGVSRSISFDDAAPAGFQRSCRAMAPLTALAQTAGALVRSAINSDGGEVQLVLHCQTRHVHVEMDCKGSPVVVDALGPKQNIPLMPSFLDKLMAGLISDIRSKSVSYPVQALTQATTARLTRDILASVGRGGSAKTTVAGNTWRGAISENRITEIHGWLKVAYSKAARSSVRRTWLLLSPLIVAGAALTNVCRFPNWVLHQVEHVTGMPSPPMRLPMGIMCELIATLPVVACAWLLAGRIGRKRLRAGVGALAHRSPRQGMWPMLGLLLATAAGWGSALLKLDVLAISHPQAPGVHASEHSPGESVTAKSTGAAATSGQPRPFASEVPSISNVSPQVHSKHRP